MTLFDLTIFCETISPMVINQKSDSDCVFFGCNVVIWTLLEISFKAVMDLRRLSHINPTIFFQYLLYGVNPDIYVVHKHFYIYCCIDFLISYNYAQPLNMPLKFIFSKYMTS